MKIERIWGVWFSPTGSTETLVRAAADSLAGVLDVPVSYRSLNTPVQRQEPLCLGPQELLIVGGPTYAGKLPNKIMPAFRELLRGEKTPAVAVVTFGNRSFDNALAELGAILSEKGFEIVGAAACAAEHAMARSLAAGRPDAEDLDRMTRFCAELGTGLAAAKQLPDPPQIPGDASAPYYRPLRADGAPANFFARKAQDRSGTLRPLRPLRPPLHDGSDRNGGSHAGDGNLHQVSGLRPALPDRREIFRRSGLPLPPRDAARALRRTGRFRLFSAVFLRKLIF